MASVVGYFLQFPANIVAQWIEHRALNRENPCSNCVLSSRYLTSWFTVASILSAMNQSLAIDSDGYLCLNCLRVVEFTHEKSRRRLIEHVA